MFRGPGATPHGQVLLSDRFRQTLLTTSLEVVQTIIYDRVLEVGISINLAHSFTQSMTTIPRMILLPLQDSSQHDTQNDQNQRIEMILHRRESVPLYLGVLASTARRISD